MNTMILELIKDTSKEVLNLSNLIIKGTVHSILNGNFKRKSILIK